MYCEFPPAPHLKPFVECYWRRQDSQADAGHRVLPDGCSDILFSTLSGEPGRLAYIGLMTSPLDSPIPAGGGFFGIRFRPAMAGVFLKFREHAALTDSNIALDDASGRRLFSQLAEAGTPLQMIARAEEYLGSPAFDPPPALAALAASVASDSGEPVERLSQLTGASPRHLRRLCHSHAGVSPKYLTRILRFRRAVERLRLRPQVQWADFAAACGYFDQAHLIREFQEFAGATPGRFIQSLRSEARLESGHDAIQT
jgi:AraC-like DNA-binding protein